jgi:hypothetical protein
VAFTDDEMKKMEKEKEKLPADLRHKITVPDISAQDVLVDSVPPSVPMSCTTNTTPEQLTLTNTNVTLQIVCSSANPIRRPLRAC